MNEATTARCFAVIAATTLAACSFEQVMDKSVADTLDLVMPTLVRIVQGNKLVLTCTWGFEHSQNRRPETETVDFKEKTVNGVAARFTTSTSIGAPGKAAIQLDRIGSLIATPVTCGKHRERVKRSFK